MAGDGGVFAFGGAGFFGSAAADTSACPADPPGRSMPGGSCWSMTASAGDRGYWILNAYDGTVRAFGDAVDHGQPADTPAYGGTTEMWPTARAIVATPDGGGYWVLLEGLRGVGTVEAFGDAAFHGDESTVAAGTGLVGAPVALVSTADGGGYWIVDSDGGVFSFGDAGSTDRWGAPARRPRGGRRGHRRRRRVLAGRGGTAGCSRSVTPPSEARWRAVR